MYIYIYLYIFIFIFIIISICSVRFTIDDAALFFNALMAPIFFIVLSLRKAVFSFFFLDIRYCDILSIHINVAFE